MQHWKAHYRDALHDTNIEIVNTEEDYSTDPLSFSLDGVLFQGTSLDDFHLADDTLYDDAKEKFSILKWGGYCTYGNYTAPYCYDLQRYELEVEIPIKIVRKKDNCEVMGVLQLAFKYVEHDMEKNQCQYFCDKERVYRDDVLISDFSVCVEGKLFNSTEKTLYFESALQDICAKMKKDYYIKSCFTCQYSEYSPYGNDNYGLMLCYRRHKNECLKVHDKYDYFEYLEAKDCDGRQETYLCEEYELRNKCCGYRGFVEGTD